jgi:chitodextrinase
VEVTRPAPTSVEVTGPAEILIGESGALTVGVAPAFADQSVTWSSSDDSIATVSAIGVVTAHDVGTVTVTAATVANPAIAGALELTVTTPAPVWSTGVIYTAGDLVWWNGAVYKALWWTKNRTPGTTNYGAWAEVGAEVQTESGVYREWTSSWIYVRGDLTVYDGHLWRAKWWQRGRVPYASAWGAWVDLGPVTLAAT